MRRLLQVIIFTPDVDRMRDFYEGGLGLHPVYAGPNWTSYRTAGVTLALHPLDGRHEQEMELTFESTDAEGEAEALRKRGIALSKVQEQTYGTTVTFRDPEGNLVALRSGGDVPAGEGPRIADVILNVADLPETVAFYREVVGLPTAYESSHWTEFDAGAVALAIHARPTGGSNPLHGTSRVALCFEVDELGAWSDEVHERGVQLATAPTEEDFGIYAEVVDPDENVIVYRQQPSPRALEDELAEPFETDEAPSRTAMRRPIKKGSKAVSRVAVRPEYHREPSTERRRPSGTTQRVSSVRGSGPDKTRLTPKRTADEKKTRSKPAIGRLQKASVKRGSDKRRAAAGLSKSRPVKKAVARRGRSGR